jgi:dTMP kinase
MFITLEGPEGSGKTTQAPLLADFLRQQGFDVLTTREPGGTEIGDQIRAVLHNLNNTGMQPRAEALLFQAARAQLVAQVIRPHLERGGVVLSDRYADSTLAYQGYGHGLPLDTLKTIIDFATGGLKPDLTIFLDLDVEVGLQRRVQGGGEWNRLDAYAVEFHRRVRQGYHQLTAMEPERWMVVDACQPFELVQRDLCQVILERLALGGEHCSRPKG